MTTPGISRMCVVGAGNMGHQIAMLAALSGYKVKCTDVVPEVLKKAEDFANTYLPERIAKGKLTQAEAECARANLSFTSSLQEAASDADFVMEAIAERLDLKRKVFADLDSICPAHTILASNSSYIVSSKIADATKRPDKIINMHFFNPALVMKLVEVVKGPHVSPETAATAMEVSASLGKTPVMLKKEIWGLLVNRILQSFTKEALYLHDMGIASYEDIDTAVVNALGWPMGPFRLMDLTGIDLDYFLNTERYQETGDPADKPSAIVVEKYVKGEWGKKVGKGFYDYTAK